MANEIIGKIPEFTVDTPSAEGLGQPAPAESAEQTAEEPSAEGTETPSEPQAEEKPAEVAIADRGEDIGVLKAELQREVEGLREARKDLILELKDMRGTRREAKQAEIAGVEQQIDDLKDLHPDDVKIIDRVLKAKGYVSQEGISKMLYEAKKQDEIQKFLSEFREYSDENDPNRLRWDPLLKEVSLYKEPTDPHLYGVILRRAHNALNGAGTSSDRGVAVKKRQAEVAGVGAGGTQRSSSVASFDAVKRQRLLDGGWSEGDIKMMEQRQIRT